MAKLIRFISQIWKPDNISVTELRVDRDEEIWSDTYPSQLISQIWD